jgi:hypothetical protein
LIKSSIWFCEKPKGETHFWLKVESLAGGAEEPPENGNPRAAFDVGLSAFLVDQTDMVEEQQKALSA